MIILLKNHQQGQNTPDLTNEEEIGSLPEKEFRIMIVKMIQNLGNRIDKMQETFNKDVEELKRNQAMMKNTINETKNTLDRTNSRITEAEERISGLEDKIVEITTAEQNKEERMKRIEDNLRDLWDNIKHTNIQIIGVPRRSKVVMICIHASHFLLSMSSLKAKARAALQ